MKTKKNAIIPSETSVESVEKSEELATRLRERILDLARKAGRNGLTINEAERQIEDHKGHSISPRFAELRKRGELVRVLVGHGRSTKHFPDGIPRYLTRYDEETGRKVNIHWIVEFAPTLDLTETNHESTASADSVNDDPESTSSIGSPTSL